MVWSAVLVALLLAFGTEAYSSYIQSIPNGGNVQRFGAPWPGVGHNAVNGGGPRNHFGQDFASHGRQWTVALCQADSDHDGFSNGVELGDPACVWNATDGAPPNRTTGISHPGFADSVPDVDDLATPEPTSIPNDGPDPAPAPPDPTDSTPAPIEATLSPDNPSPAPMDVASPLPAAGVGMRWVVSVTMNVAFDSFNATDFRTDLAAELSLDVQRVHILNVRAGSVVADVAVDGDTDGTLLASVATVLLTPGGVLQTKYSVLSASVEQVDDTPAPDRFTPHPPGQNPPPFIPAIRDSDDFGTVHAVAIVMGVLFIALVVGAIVYCYRQCKSARADAKREDEERKSRQATPSAARGPKLAVVSGGGGFDHCPNCHIPLASAPPLPPAPGESATSSRLHMDGPAHL